ncbi:hypothetical protein EC991_004527 [Linnemannia zychae]|nr:hypothetical protein EC991_004527 [Linnemannia zychae]
MIHVAQKEQNEELMKHAPGWKHENASDSEAIVKADREPHPKDVSDMQHETVKHLKKDEGDFIDNLKTKATETAKEIADKAKSMSSHTSSQGGEYLDKAKRAGQEAKREFGDNAKSVSDQGGDYVDQAKRAGNEAKKIGEEHLSESDYVERAKKEANNAQGMMKDGAQKVSDFVKNTVDSAKKAVGMDDSSRH